MFQRTLQERITQLSEEEQVLARRVMAGEPNSQIARSMGVCVRTIECRRSRMMRKLQVHNVAQLARVFWSVRSDDGRDRAADAQLVPRRSTLCRDLAPPLSRPEVIVDLACTRSPTGPA